MHHIHDIGLAPQGEEKIRWVAQHMPVLGAIAEDFRRDQPFKGLKITLSVHLEAKTAWLCRVLEMGGAQMHVTGSNPLSTQDDVAAALAAGGMDVHAVHGVSQEEYDRDLCAVLDAGPNIIIDDGGDLVERMHSRFPHRIPQVIGGCEETTTGILRLKAMDRAGTLRFPMVLVNDADCKHLFDNRYGTGQSVWDGIMRTTNLIIAGKTVVVAGYGWCGSGIALRAKGMGASVIVTEVDPFKALDATMNGMRVMPMAQAAPLGDLFITATGCRDVIGPEHFAVMKDNAVLCNAGHFDCEVDAAALRALAVETIPQRENIVGYRMADGRTLNLIADGRLVNQAAGNGHPAEIMDMSYAVQALAAQWLVRHREELEVRVYDIPAEIDEEIGRAKLAALGLAIDALTPEQEAYLSSWQV